MPRYFRLMTGRLGTPALASREETVRRMTSLPAQRFGLAGRGTIRKGAYADIAIWREEDFCETATYAKPHAFSRGVQAVFVNGKLSYRDGRFMGAGGGRLLSRP
jgi:N-acyl-D-amino-acid deacylase